MISYVEEYGTRGLIIGGFSGGGHPWITKRIATA